MKTTKTIALLFFFSSLFFFLLLFFFFLLRIVIIIFVDIIKICFSLILLIYVYFNSQAERTKILTQLSINCYLQHNKILSLSDHEENWAGKSIDYFCTSAIIKQPVYRLSWIELEIKFETSYFSITSLFLKFTHILSERLKLRSALKTANTYISIFLMAKCE